MSSLVKSVPIDLDKTRHLRYDFNALCEIEEGLGITLPELGTKLSGKIKLSDLRTVVWAGLIHEDESLSIKQVGALLVPSKLGEIAEKVSKAFSEAFPSDEEIPKNGKGPEPKKNTTGKDS